MQLFSILVRFLVFLEKNVRVAYSYYDQYIFGKIINKTCPIQIVFETLLQLRPIQYFVQEWTLRDLDIDVMLKFKID